jgi:hypothetical protein
VDLENHSVKLKASQRRTIKLMARHLPPKSLLAFIRAAAIRTAQGNAQLNNDTAHMPKGEEVSKAQGIAVEEAEQSLGGKT